MHDVMGLTWGEIASILGIISALLTGFIYVFKNGVKHLLSPVEQKITQLINSINELTEEFKAQKHDITRLDERIDNVEREVMVQKEKIKYIEQKTKGN